MTTARRIAAGLLLFGALACGGEAPPAPRSEGETACHTERECSGAEPYCGPRGVCVECATHAHCPDETHCAAGRCELDVCQGTERHCDRRGRGIETCTASGSGFATTACDSSQSCTEASGEPECVDWECEPESETCDGDARYLELCSVDGLSVARRVDCFDEAAVCLDGACVPRACEPNEVSCRDGALERCSGDGTGYELVRSCRDDEVCDADTESCLPILCVPEAPACDDDAVRSCNRSGTGFTGRATRCDDQQACFEGACLPRICISDYACKDGDSFQCVENGTRLTRAERCESDSEQPEFCNADTGRCELVGCEPSQPVCSGVFATVCADDGSAPVAGGVDCTLLDQACFAGACRPRLCTEEFVCREGDLHRCEENGTALQLQGECGRPALCDAGEGTCLSEVCTPGDPICNGSIATTCDETGTDYEPEGTDCAATSQGCFEGACNPLVCSAAAYFCADGDVRRCDETGTRSALADACDAGEHCADGEARCVPNACSPGAAVCAGSIATTCRSDGSGPEAGGSDCALNGKACHLGECRELVCPPSQRFCEDGHVRLCDASGTNSGPYATCLPQEYCDASGGARCRSDRCRANELACAGEAVAICNEEGSGYAAVGVDCATAGEVCDLTVGCADAAEDTFGGTDFASSNPHSTLYLITLEALSSRTLVELASYFGVSQDTEVTWLVYRSETSTGTYSKHFELAGTAGAGQAKYHPSGAMAVPLEAGRYYAVGALVRGAHDEFQSSIPPPPASFAAILGTTRTDTESTPSEVWIEASVGTMPAIRTTTE